MAQHHLGFAGSITLRPTTLIAVVRDTVASLARHGFDRFFFLNGHGGNIATLSAAYSEIHADASLGTANRPALRCKTRNWWDGPKVGALSDELYGAALGSHATPAEVSLTYFAYPEAVKKVAMSPELAPKGPIYDAADYRRRFPDGRIGSNPALANPEDGKRLYDVALEETAEAFQAFLAGQD
jgi:creatinine amidohydrolase